MTKDSRHGLVKDIIRDTINAAKVLKVEKSLEVLTDKRKIDYSCIDIVTNSGFVRPIDANIISQLPAHAVIPLMWETWEFRGDEVDLSSAKKHGILVLGTNESHPAANLLPYVDMLLLKMLFELKLSGYKSKIILIASDKFGEYLASSCRKFNIEFSWFGNNTKGAKKLEHISEFCFRELDKYEAVIVGEMKEERCLIGINNSLLTTNMLFRINPNIKVGVFAGNVNAEALRKKKIVCIPKTCSSKIL